MRYKHCFWAEKLSWSQGTLGVRAPEHFRRLPWAPSPRVMRVLAWSHFCLT